MIHKLTDLDRDGCLPKKKDLFRRESLEGPGGGTKSYCDGYNTRCDEEGGIGAEIDVEELTKTIKNFIDKGWPENGDEELNLAKAISQNPKIIKLTKIKGG